MRFIFNTQALRYPAVSISLFVVLCIWTFSRIGFFQWIDGYVYDLASTYSVSSVTSPSPVLMIEAKPHQQDLPKADSWPLLLQQLHDLGAKQIIFSFIPQGVSENFFKEAEQMGDVFFGRQLLSGSSLSSEQNLEVLPIALQNQVHHIGIVSLPASQMGVYRTQNSMIQVHQKAYPVLEYLAASHVQLENMLFPEHYYRLNFSMGLDQLPRVRFERAIHGGLTPALVEGKSVLIGIADQRVISGLHTPISHGEQTFTLLEYQAFALHTLLSQQVIHTTPEIIVFLLLLSIAVTGLISYQWMNDHSAIKVTFGLVFLYLGSAWFCLSYFQIWLPVMEMIAAQVLLLFLLAKHKNDVTEKEMNYLVMDASVKMMNELMPQNFYSTEGHWQQIINMVNQTLELNRAIFLERIIGDHRVREVASLHCNLQDIDEVRRDYERTPYSTAIAEKGPVVVSKTYFKHQQEGEVQYLTPLVFAGKVMGFWAFGIAKDKVQSIPHFNGLVNNYARQIAELLYHRDQFQLQEKTEHNVINQYMNLKAGDSLFATLKNTLSMMDRKISTLEQVLQGLDEAVIMYDLFGRVTQVNQNTETIFQDTQIRAYEASALDMLIDVTGMQASEARQTLRHVILEHKILHFKANNLTSESPNLMLSIHTLSDMQQNNVSQGYASKAYDIRGIMFEFHAQNATYDLDQLKWVLAGHMNGQLLKDSKKVCAAIKQLKRTCLNAENRSKILGEVRMYVQHISKIVLETGRMLKMNEDTQAIECFPIDSKSCLQTALATMNGMAEQKDVHMKMQAEGLSMVFAGPDQLDKVFGNILDIILDDAADSSNIKIKASSRKNGIMYEFHNQGFGIPNERLQDYLYSNELPETKKYRTLRQHVDYIEKWGGKLNVQSQIGQGFRVKMWLRSFVY